MTLIAQPKVLQDIIDATVVRVREEKKRIFNPEYEVHVRSLDPLPPFTKFLDLSPFPIISEIKFATPTKGVISKETDPVKVAAEYENAGASAYSILTEPYFFRGHLDFIRQVRKSQPKAFILMKDFVVDDFQIFQAKEAGANAILLLASLFSEHDLRKMYNMARGLDLLPLVEVHNEEELKKARYCEARLIGVNNRNLKTMEVSVKTSEKLVQLKGNGERFVSESGIASGKEVRRLRDLGFDGFLIGSHFMKQPSPGAALAELLKEATNG